MADELQNPGQDEDRDGQLPQRPWRDRCDAHRQVNHQPVVYQQTQAQPEGQFEPVCLGQDQHQDGPVKGQAEDLDRPRKGNGPEQRDHGPDDDRHGQPVNGLVGRILVALTILVQQGIDGADLAHRINSSQTSRYFSLVAEMTSSGKRGPGGDLSQSSVSR